MAIGGKILMVMLAIDLAMFLGGASGGSDLLVFGENTFLKINQSAGTVNITEDLSNSTSVSSEGAFTQLFQIITLPIFLILDFLNLMLSVLFAPITVMLNAGFPGDVIIMIGGVMLVAYIIGFMSIIRGGDI